MCGRAGEIIVEPLVIEEVSVASITVVFVSATKGVVEVEENEKIDEDGSVLFPFSVIPVLFFFDL